MNPLSRQRQDSWVGGDDPLWLLTPAEMDELPPETVVESIAGEKKRLSQDPDRDTRGGYTAWGLRESTLAIPTNYKEVPSE